MVSRRVFLGTIVCVSLVGALALRHWWSAPVSADYTAGNFSTSANGTAYALDSATNVSIGSFVLPNPATDTLLIDGAGNAVAAKNTLTAFSGSFQMFDTDNGDDLDAAEAIFASANTAIESGDSVLTTGTNALTSFDNTETPGTFYVYFDQGATSGSYDSGEDVYRQYFDNVACTTPDGTTNIRTPESTWAWFDLDSDNVIDQESPTTYGSILGESFFRDADADGFPSAGDSIIISQASGIKFFAGGDKVCFDGSVVNDGEYDANEVLWFDVAGDCASFTSTTDSILVGVAAPSGGSTLASVDNELGYLDNNTSNSFTCTRGGTCETPVYSGTNATSVGGGGDIAQNSVFFDSSVEGTDGIRTTGTGWDESGAAEKIVSVSSVTSGGEAYYIYNDCNTSTTFSGSEDIYIQVVAGVTAAITNGVTARTFDSNERVLLTPGVEIAAFNASSGAIVKSADANLTVGALNGSGTDQVLSASATGVLDAIPATNKYFDHDSSGTFAATDDVIVDGDSSGYYNADDLLTLSVSAAANAQAITDAYLSSIFLYERVGSSCVGSGTDTLLGSDVSSPFLNQAITVTKGPYASSDATGVRTICVFADIANNSVHGKIWTLEIPTNGAVFSSNSASPTSAFTAVSSTVEFVAPLTATISASSTLTGTRTSYGFTYTLTEDDISNAQGLFAATFPAAFNVATSSVSCLDDGVSVTVTPSVSGQTVRGVNASGGAVASGSVVTCTVTNVLNPVTAGTSAAFTVHPYAATTSRTLYIDTDNTVTMTAHDSDEEESSSNANDMTLGSPNGGESYADGDSVSITWVTTGNAMSYVILSYSTDGGTMWTEIANHEGNDGIYAWTVPDVTSSNVMVKIEGTDNLVVVDEDVSDAVFSITGSTPSESSTETESTTTEGEEAVIVEEEEPQTTSALSAGIFVKLANDSTVYAIDEDLVRHPFFNASTYFTYEESFDAVYEIDADLLAESTLGGPQLVNPGTILVKFVSSPNVYTVNMDTAGTPYLRLILDEAVVSTVFGDSWHASVLEMPDSAMPYHYVSSEPETVESLTTWVAEGSLTDRWHLMYEDASLDADGDGAATWLEASWGTSPYDADMDNDGYNDKLEVDTGHSPFFGGGV